ncbi:MAG TPA: energy transducer TonB [Dokdonella sp.]|uniref:energy transducer TonB n=1 Tax=Dokdonella sp. TaxID=2291710 RepID=UPI002D7F31CF|nr:energy transducer TonB [Dokdonella sp.]HET9031329.1 energy transducer TonB [Dokdonella sp.]
MNARNFAVRIGLVVALALTSFTAWAGGDSEVRKQAEASMVLTGSVEVNLDGSLRSYQLDQPEKIDPSIRDFLDRNIKAWSFAVDSLPQGVSAPATVLNSMSILVVAKPLDGDTYTLQLAASYFSPKDPEPGTEIAYKAIKAPRYPDEAVRARVGGKVFLVVKVAADGTVDDAMTEQVNLNAVAHNEKEMERWRAVLANAALKAVKRWTFVVPTRGKEAGQPFFLARVPVEYEINPKKQEEYGKWAPYVRGPRHANQWEQANKNPGFAPDAVAANGGVYSNAGLRLKSPLQGSANGG